MPALPLLLACAPLAGCILPLQFEDQADAGNRDLNYPPVVVGATPSLLERGSIPTQPPYRIFTIEVEDKDVNDTTYLRVYRDYAEAPSGYLSEDAQEGLGQVRRTFQIDTRTWCNQAADGEEFVFEVVVADQDFLNVQEEPFFRALPETAGRSSAFWVMACQDI